MFHKLAMASAQLDRTDEGEETGQGVHQWRGGDVHSASNSSVRLNKAFCRKGSGEAETG